MSDLTEKQLHIIQHALGLDKYGQGKSYRNHYVCGPGHHGYSDCVALVCLGMATEHPPREIFGGDSCFTVTERGRQAVVKHSPPPPKLTRGQRRYRAFLDADPGVSFGEWIRSCS